MVRKYKSWQGNGKENRDKHEEENKISVCNIDQPCLSETSNFELIKKEF